MNENNTKLVPVIDSNSVNTTLEQISEPLEEFVKYNGLPTQNVLATNNEKTILFSNFANAIQLLPLDIKEKSEYLTKFIVASAVGLFDGALNFLWDEIVKTLRKKIIAYDLLYFYSVAEQQNSKYKNLNKEEDLSYISDFDLLCILKRIGLIDDMSFKVLENINYLRNNASAAHPNTNELSGLKLSSLLEDGIRYAILIEPNTSTVTIKKLFNNILTSKIPTSDYDLISEELLKIENNRLNDFAKSIFGLYCDLDSTEVIQTNIIQISKRIWNSLSEETKYEIGSKFGFYRKNGDVKQKDRVQYFLETVGGINYKDSDSIVSDMLDLLNQLKSVHFGINNFYNEYSYAKEIEQLIPNTGIPGSIRKTFVTIICLCYIGNGLGFRDGVDESAFVIYDRMVENFGNDEIKDFILSFQDSDFIVALERPKTDRRVRMLSAKLLEKTTNETLKNGLEIIIQQPAGQLKNLAVTPNYLHWLKKISN